MSDHLHPPLDLMVDGATDGEIRCAANELTDDELTLEAARIVARSIDRVGDELGAIAYALAAVAADDERKALRWEVERVGNILDAAIKERRP